ncbi:MAG: hydroxymyristoyl-ACP dehydratase, partial [Bacteroidales bacterium]
MLSSDHILDLIPQRSPFVFVDKLTNITENSFKSQYLVRKENPLCNGHILCEAGIIEHIAQSMAAHIGYLSKDEVKIGMLGSVNHFTV